MSKAIRSPQPHEEYITISDNQGRERIQHVVYVVTDVRNNAIYVTSDGLLYAHDSLRRKGQDHISAMIDVIPTILSDRAIVIQDHLSPDDTLLYYRQRYIPAVAQQQLLCVVVKIRQGIRFFYNFFPQQSGKVKGYREVPPPTIWYIARGQNPRNYGLLSQDE